MKEAQETILIPQEPSSFRLISSLGIAGFFSGLLLVSVFIYTQPLIEANKAEAMRLAIFKVLPGCTSYETFSVESGSLVKVSGDSQEGIFAGYDNEGNLIGFAVPAEEPGFQDIIKALYGYSPSTGQIIGFEVLESKETPGLGDKIFKDLDFVSSFASLDVEPTIEPVKKGQKNLDNQVETITGATISSKAVINMLNNSIEEWRERIDQYYQNLE